MKRVLLIVVGVVGVLIIVAMLLKYSEVAAGLAGGLVALLPKLIEKVLQ